MLKELETVALVRDIPEAQLAAGDIAILDPIKITRYLLDTSHTVGGPRRESLQAP